jgi:pimeloyl-ACP methyl ester carboxylesterase
VEVSETRYAQSGDVAIAYSVAGAGPVDLVMTPGAVSNVELLWHQPLFASFRDRIASFTRLIVFDKRGTGLSDRVKKIATLEERADDIRAVMDAAGSVQAVIMGISEGGPMAVVFAATHPGRTQGLILYGSHARMTWAPDYPWRPTLEEYRRYIAEEERSPTPVNEVSARSSLELLMPSVADDDELVRWWAMFSRMSISPGAWLDLDRMNMEINVSDVLPTIRVPTVVIQRTDDRVVKAGEGRYVAERIPGARYVELDGADHIPVAGDSESVIREIRRFVEDLPDGEPEPTRCWRRCSSPTSSTRQRRRRNSATAAGASSWNGTTMRFAVSSSASAGMRSTRPETGSSPPSTGRRGPSGARAR